MPTIRRRLIITPSDQVWAAVDELGRLQGKPKATIVGDMLDAVAPAMLEQVRLFERLQQSPEHARELVMQYGAQGIATISQQMLELPPVRRKPGRPRKNATP